MKCHLASLLRLILALMALAASARTSAGAEPAPQGNLLIVGGALRETNEPVMRRFVDLATVRGERRIFIVPAASGSPVRNSERFRTSLARYGVDPVSVEILPLAVRNDASTDFDESAWAGNGEDETLAARVAGATGFWFLGGDQTRITDILLRHDGSDTPVLAAIREAIAAGAVLGGTSAGAAMQSDPMIAGGVSLAALLGHLSDDYTDMNDQETGPLILRRGLGFFPFGVVDQHFDRKARLGRLLEAVRLHRGQTPLGFGVDEDTALEVNLATGRARVHGDRTVTVIDLRNVRVEGEGDARTWRRARLHLLAEGDIIDLHTLAVTPDPRRKPTRGREYYRVPDPASQGALSANPSLPAFLGFDLVDNAAVDSVETKIWHQDGRGFRLTFAKTDETRGYWGTPNGTMDQYTVLGVDLSIEPVRVTIDLR